MRKYQLYAVVVLASLLLAIILPKYYAQAFSSRTQNTVVSYSPVNKQFIKRTVSAERTSKISYSTIDDNASYTLDEYKALHPFLYIRDLKKIDKFPEEFSAFLNDPQVIKKERRFLKIRPRSANIKNVNLYPLFESKPKYSSLTYPADLFKLSKQGITFINSHSNTINSNKSKAYNKLFKKLGASLPLRKVFGNPTIRKAFDEGYFITDSSQQLFHLKMIKGEPSVQKIKTNGLDIQYILIQEHSKKEFYGIIVTKQSDIYLLMYDDYAQIKLELEGYDYKHMIFRMYTTPINRVFTISHSTKDKKQKIIKTVVTNLDYEKEKENTYRYALHRGELYESIRSILFPYTISLKVWQEYYVTFSITAVSYTAFALALLLASLYLAYAVVSQRGLKEHIPNALLIAIGGIYTIIPLLVFKRFYGIKKIKKENK